MKKKNEIIFINFIRNIVINTGDILMVLYIIISSFMIAHYFIQVTYLKNEHLFIEYVINYDGVYMVTIFWLAGIIVAGIWVVFGMIAIYSFKHQQRLISMGFKKSQSLVEKAIFPRKEEEPKKDEKKCQNAKLKT